MEANSEISIAVWTETAYIPNGRPLLVRIQTEFPSKIKTEMVMLTKRINESGEVYFDADDFVEYDYREFNT